METSRYRVFWAGELFDHKHLIGNAALAGAVNAVYPARYQVRMPQNLNLPEPRAIDIRNADLKLLFESDVAVFNFDGTDLDSGTVVEFIFAKMLDIPAVLLRSDFRAFRDQGSEGDPWNLMCTGYPRTENLFVDAMTEYTAAFNGQPDFTAALNGFCRDLAQKIVTAMDRAIAMNSEFNGNLTTAQQAYTRAVQTAGGGLSSLFPAATIAALVNAKAAKGLL